MIRLIATVAAVLLCLTSVTRAADNLLANGGLEEIGSDRFPIKWSPLVIGAPPTFTIDDATKHEGKVSIRIDAPEITRSYIRSEPISVAPGETIKASAWAKAQNVPIDRGTVILIAEFTDAADQNEVVAKINVANTKEPIDGWQLVEGTVKVPPLAASMRIRAGFSYCKGTCWWDDLTVRAEQPLVCRIALAEPRLSPAMKTLPVTILNRDGRKGPVTLRATLNKKTTDATIELTGDTVQNANVPIAITKPGKVDVTVALLAKGSDKPIFAEERNAIVPPPIVLAPPSPTHWVVEDGPPVIEGMFDLAISDNQRNGGKLDIRIEDAKKSAIATLTIAANQADGLADGIGKFTLKVKPLPVGDYTLIAELHPGKGEPIRIERPWHVIPRADAKVTLNAGGYPEYKGEAIFPLGIFNGAKFPEQHEAGFTVTHAYNASRIEANPLSADLAAFDYIDKTQQNGMKMLFQVPMKQVIRGDWETVRRRIRMFRNHPGLLAWIEEEGFARGDFKPDTLKKLHAIVKEEDPNHPFMVGDSRDVIGRVTDRSNFFPLDQMDMGIWWWYPFPLRERTGDALLGEDAGPPGNELVPPTFLTLAKTDKPIWVGIQSYKKPGNDSRYPTPVEYRAQAYLGIITGGKGLMWYGGSVTGGLFLAPEEGHWPDLKKLVTELHDLAPVFMSPTIDSPKVDPQQSPISVCIKQSTDRRIMIAVNRGATPAEVTLSSKQIPAGPAKVLNEDRTVTTTAGALHDTFAPYAVHVYELPR